MRYKHNASESLAITLRARDWRKTARKKEWRSVICRKVKWLLLLLSNMSKIPHLYPLSIPALSRGYIPNEPSKENRRHSEELSISILGPCFPSLFAFLFLHYFPQLILENFPDRGRQNSNKGSKYISEQH